MEHSTLPLNFYCRSARLCMKKAAFSRKAHLFSDELLHLKKFHSLVSTSIPSHPLYEEQKTEKQIVELQTYLTETRKRMHQLETDSPSPKATRDVTSMPKVKRSRAKPVVLPNFGNNHTSLPSPQTEHSQKVKGPSKKQLRRHQQNCKPWPQAVPSQLEPGSDPEHGESTSPTCSLSPLRKFDYEGVKGSLELQTSSTIPAMVDMRKKCNLNGLRNESSPSLKRRNHVSPSRDQRSPPKNNKNKSHDNTQAPPTFIQTSECESMDDDGEDDDDDDDNAVSVAASEENYKGCVGPSTAARDELPISENVPRVDPDASNKTESMHKRWSKSRKASGKSTPNEGNGAKLSNMDNSQKATTDSQTPSNPGNCTAEGLTVTIRTKLEEEYEKLKEQMKWLKQKDEGTLSREEFMRNKKGSLSARKLFKNDPTNTTEESSYDISVGLSRNGNAHVADNLRQQGVHGQNMSGISHVEKPLNANVAGETANSASLHHSTLPFSHYISKLKQLVPENGSNDVTVAPLHSLSCNTRISRACSSPLGVQNSGTTNEEIDNQAEGLPSGSPLAESLTYSNPVFDVEGEAEAAPKCNEQQDSGFSGEHDDECMGEDAEVHSDSPDHAQTTETEDRMLSHPTATKSSKEKQMQFDMDQRHDDREGHEKPDVTLQSEDAFSIAGHKFMFAKDYFLKKLQEKQKIAQIKKRNNQGVTENRDTLEPPNATNAETSGWASNNYANSGCTQDDLNNNHDADGNANCDFEYAAQPSQSTPDWKTHYPQDSDYCDLERGEQVTSDPEQSMVADDSHATDGESWLQAKIQQLEQDLKEHKDNSKKERDVMKGYIDRDIRAKLDEVVGSLQWTQNVLIEKEQDKKTLDQEFRDKVENCENKFKLIHEQMNSLLGELKYTVIKEMRETTLMDLHDVKELCKGQLEVIKMDVSRNMDNLRNELTSSIEAVQQQTAIKMDHDYDDLERSIMQKLDSQGALTSTDKDVAIAELRTELHLVREEIQQLTRGKEEIRQQVGQLTKLAEEAKKTLSREQCAIRSENNALQKQLHQLKKQSVQSMRENDVMKKEVQVAVQGFQSALDQMKEDNASSRKDTEALLKLEESLKNDNLSLTKLYAEAREAEDNLRQEVQMIKAFREEFLKDQSSSGDKALVLERVDQLSHFYHCALEEVREDLMHVKMIGQERLNEIEYRWEDFLRRQQQRSSEKNNSIHDLVMDSLESRLTHMEQVMGNTQEFQKSQLNVESALTIIEKNQEHAALAAAKAIASAKKADEVLDSFRKELENSRLNNMRLQENLHVEKETAMEACCEIKKITVELLQEKDLAIAASSEAKKRSFEIWEGLQKDMVNLRNSLLLIEKDKEVASAAANEAMAAASRAEVVLEQLSKACADSYSHFDVLKEMDISRRSNDDLSEAEDRINHLAAAITKVMETTSQLNEEHHKQGQYLYDLKNLVETTTAEQKSVIERVIGLSTKVETLDNTLTTLGHTVGRVQRSTTDMEQAAAKHETAVGEILAQFEKRIHHLENPFQTNSAGDIPKEQITLIEQQQILNLWKEMSFLFQKLQRAESQEEAVELNTELRKALNALESKVHDLEGRLCHVELASTRNARKLDSKIETVSSQVQTAVDAAVTAEGKCSTLGAELVKVFRVLASLKKERLQKESEENSDSQRRTPASCGGYKNSSPKESSVTPEMTTRSETQSAEARHMDLISANNNVLRLEGPTTTQPEVTDRETRSCSTDTSIFTKQGSSGYTTSSVSNMENYTGSSSTSASRMVLHGSNGSLVQLGRKFSLSSDPQVSNTPREECDTLMKGDSKMVILEGKLPITQGKRRIECTRKESVCLGGASARGDYQMTDIRLDGGRIYVNVSHRSAFISGTRLVKQGDTFTVKTQT